MRIGPHVFLLAFVACGDSTPPPNDPTTTASTTPPVASSAPVASASASSAPKEPTKEEKEKIEAAKALADDKAKWAEKNKAELARWTPELHAAAKALAEKTYPNGKAAVQAALAGKHRSLGNAERDKYRHPLETLDLFGFQPTMNVLEIGPGEGWYTEILAPALAAKGHLYETVDNAGPPDDRRAFYAERQKAFLDRSPELYGKVTQVSIDGAAPALSLDGKLDMVLIMRGVHGLVNRGTLDKWLAEINKSLKPNGVLGIEEHRAKEGADPKESSKKGYVPEKWL